MTIVSTFTDDNNPALTDKLPYIKNPGGSPLNRLSDMTSVLKLVKRPIIIAIGDETTVLTTGTAKVTFRIPFGFSLESVRASLTVAGTGAALVTIDVNDDGVSVFTTRVTIDATEKTSETAAAPSVLTSTPLSIADDSEITIDIDVIDTDNVAAGLKVTLIGNET